jgi:Tol biopolymer transport system component
MVRYDELPDDDWGVWEPNWSLANRIAFTMMRDLRQTDGSIAHESHIAWIDGTGGAPEFYSVTGREYTPQWSPDGTWLAYVSYDERVPGADLFSTAVPTVEPPPGQPEVELPTILEADLWVVSADGAAKYSLTRFSVGSVHTPRWSPDGELISFVYSPTPNDDTFWMIANQTNAIPTQLSYEWNLTLDTTWLPDSSAILAAVRDFRDVSENRLWRIPLIGNADEDAAFYLADDTFEYADFPRFSPDGRYLAFRNEYSLVVIDLVFNTVRRFAEDRPGNTPPVWSPSAFTGEEACEG